MFCLFLCCLCLFAVMNGCGDKSTSSAPRGMILVEIHYDEPMLEGFGETRVVERMVAEVSRKGKVVEQADLERNGSRWHGSVWVPVGTYEVTVRAFVAGYASWGGADSVRVVARETARAMILLRWLAPEEVKVARGTGWVQLSWTFSKDNRWAGFAVLRSAAENGEYRLLQGSEGLSTRTTGFVDTLVADDERYFYRIAAVDTSGSQAALWHQMEVPVQGWRDDVPPGVAQDLSAAIDPDQPGNVTLSWIPPDRNADGTVLTGLDGYTVLRATDRGSFAPVATLPGYARDFVDTVDVLYWYEYRVRVFDTDGNESEAAVARVWVPDSVELASPLDVPALASGALVGTRIAFQRERSVHVIDIDGANQVDLGPGGIVSWSPDGAYIAVERRQSVRGETFYIMRPDGSEVVKVGVGRKLFWSPDGSKVVLDGMVVVDLHGTVLLQIADASPVAWSPDGSLILFTRDLAVSAFAPLDLFLIRADGTDERHMDKGYPWSDAFTPDGHHFIYNGDGDENSSIHLMDVEGGDPVRLFSHGRGGLPSPRWSPDGTRLLFYKNPDNNNSIFVMNLDGTGEIQIGSGNDASWSPDGEWIAFVFLEFRSSPRSERYFVNVVTADGTEEKWLGETDGNRHTHSWSPDGSLIAVTLKDGDAGTNQIYLMEPNGGNRVRLVEGDHPSWSPFSESIRD